MGIVLAQPGWSMDQISAELLGYVESGGFVMWPLVVATLVLWFALGWRLMVLQRGSKKSLRELVAGYEGRQGREASVRGVVDLAAWRGVRLAELGLDDLRAYLDDAYAGLRDEMGRWAALVRAIVAAAPLAGLLGTVTGMIETFDSLASMSLFSQSGGIAGGISVALISTQMGLAVAIPGLVVGRILDRKQSRLDAELDELTEILSARQDAIRAAAGQQTPQEDA